MLSANAKTKKKDCWEQYSSTDQVNQPNDIFGGLKRLANRGGPQSSPSKLLKDGCTITDPKEILTEFSSQFFPKEPPGGQVHCDTRAFVSSSLSKESFPLTVSVSDVDYAVKSLKSTATPGPDGLSAVWFKLFYPHIKLLFHAMLNACLKLSYFPLTWRAASILILKKPSKPDYFNPSAFRGISILNASSKVFEIIIHDILKKLAHEGKWFSENQHGFRPGKST